MLQGLLIGNGWISPTEQYLSYLPKAYKDGLIQGDSPAAKQVESHQAVCNTRLNEPGGADHVDVAECEAVLTTLLRVAQRDGGSKEPCVNMYDIRLKDSYPSCGMNWPPDLDLVKPYLRRPDVLKALHVNPDKKTGWTECVGTVGSAFKALHSKPSITLLPNLLEHMPIVLFSGEKDLICNHLGTEDLIHRMVWNGGTGFELSPGTWAPRRDWTFEGEAAGIYQEARNLTYILFYNASHMVPFDYPRRTRDMLDRFLGVDIASIGGTPADSRIDGEKGLEVSVGGHPNSTVAQEKEKQKLQRATRHAYYRAGEVVLLVVVISASVWAWFIWRGRRRSRISSSSRGLYQGLFPSDENASASPPSPSLSPHHARNKRFNRHHRRRPLPGQADIEAAAEFDENELAELHVRRPAASQGGRPPDDDDDDVDDEAEGSERFKLAHASDDDDDDDGNNDKYGGGRGGREDVKPL